jgi:hypothetical protein
MPQHRAAAEFEFAGTLPDFALPIVGPDNFAAGYRRNLDEVQQ